MRPEEKTTLPKVRIAVLGKANVGKSGRFLWLIKIQIKMMRNNTEFKFNIEIDVRLRLRADGLN